MSQWALITNGVVAELITTNPEGLYHPSLVWVESDGTPGVEVWWTYENGVFTPPSAAPAQTLAQQAATALSAGLAITSTDTPVTT